MEEAGLYSKVLELYRRERAAPRYSAKERLELVDGVFLGSCRFSFEGWQLFCCRLEFQL